MTTLRTLSEFGFIDQISAFLPSNANVLVGLGDDCAVVQGGGDRLWLLSCDASLEKVHFRRDWASAEEIGWKAAASALSDIAAMGGRPAFVLTTVAAPGDMDATSYRMSCGEWLRPRKVVRRLLWGATLHAQPKDCSWM